MLLDQAFDGYDNLSLRSSKDHQAVGEENKQHGRQNRN
jgi:hypothetical protein